MALITYKDKVSLVENPDIADENKVTAQDMNEIKKVVNENQSLTYDNLPVGSVIDFDGDTVPTGYEEVTDPNNYSLEEQVIGTWIDGKPIYRKSFFISGFPTFTSNKHTFNHNIANFGLCLKIYGVLYDTGNKCYFNLPYTGRGTADVMLYSSSSIIYVEQGPYGNNRLKDFYITIEYTKTKD